MVEVVVEELVVGLFEVAADDLVVQDVEPFEDSGVEQLAAALPGLRVGAWQVAELGQGLVEPGNQLLGVRGVGGQTSVSGLTLPLDAVHLLAQQVQRHRTGVVGLQHGLAFVHERLDAASEPGDLGLGEAGLAFDVLGDLGADLVGVDVIESRGAVVVLDGCFDDVGGDVALDAAGGVLASSEAVEVRVDDTHLALGHRHGDDVAAAATPQAALEIVVVLAALDGAAAAVVVEHVLDAREGGRVGQRRVGALILLALVLDDADVVAVAQQPVQLRATQRLGRVLPRRAGAQGAVFQLVAQLAERVHAGREGVEGVGHQRCAFRVGLDDLLDPALWQLAVDVEIAQWCPAEGAAALGLGGEALLDLGREVVGVELGHAGQHGVHEHPRR